MIGSFIINPQLFFSYQKYTVKKLKGIKIYQIDRFFFRPAKPKGIQAIQTLP